MSYADEMIDDYLDKLLSIGDSQFERPKRKRRKKGKPRHRWSAVRKARQEARRLAEQQAQEGQDGTQ